MAGIDKTNLRSMAIDIAKQLDRKDTKGEDGKIEASIWNEFVADKGGKKIRTSITLENAIKSIATYIARNASKTGEAFGDIADKWFDKESMPVDETVPIEETNPTEDTKQTTPQKTKSSSQVQADIDFINARVTVPSKTVTAKKPTTQLEVQSIKANRINGKNVAESLRRAFNSAQNLETLKRRLEDLLHDYNIAYVLQYMPDLADKIDAVDAFGFGFDKKEVVQYVLTPLMDRAVQVGILTKSQAKSILKQSKDSSLDDIKQLLTTYSKLIRDKDEQIVLDYDNQMQQYNANVEEVEEYNKTVRPKLQKCFDDGVKFLAEVANMNPKPETYEIENSEGECVKGLELPDGRWINVTYDENYEIKEIAIINDPKLNSEGKDYAEVVFYTYAAFVFDHVTTIGEIYYSGYEQLKALVEKIFD